MNRLSVERRAQVIGCLVEGMSIRATVRTTGVAKNTVVKLVADLGEACAEYQDAALTNLDIQRVEADEIWSFCYSKQKNVPEEFVGTPGAAGIVDRVAQMSEIEDDASTEVPTVTIHATINIGHVVSPWVRRTDSSAPTDDRSAVHA